MTVTKVFLVVAAIGLTPIALGYGAAPDISMSFLFGLELDSTDGKHVFRAIMGLYLALAGFWIAGALSERLALHALWSLAVFMLGLAAGRVLSLVLDGSPHPLLLVLLVLEIGFGLAALYLIRKEAR